MKILIFIILIVSLGLAAYFIFRPNPVSSPQSAEPVSRHVITIKTNRGDIKFKTYNEDAPQTVTNFISLVSKGFYDNLPFHRVVSSFVIQGGDPLCADPPQGTGSCGTGGPGYRFADELDPNTLSYQQGYKKGVVAMANSGPNTNGSQFFIMLEDQLTLPHAYTIFGFVIEGQEVVDTIGLAEVDDQGRPLDLVIIESVNIESY